MVSKKYYEKEDIKRIIKYGRKAVKKTTSCFTTDKCFIKEVYFGDDPITNNLLRELCDAGYNSIYHNNSLFDRTLYYHDDRDIDYKFLEETIGDPPDGLEFSFTSVVEQSDEDDSTKKNVERKIIPTYRWPINPNEPFITIEEYVSKLKKIL